MQRRWHGTGVHSGADRPLRAAALQSVHLFFAVGALASFAALAIAGEVDRHRLGLALIVLPGVPLGLLLSKPLIGRLPAERVRPMVLAVCAASALALLVDELL